MHVKGTKHRLDFLTRLLTATEWRLLGAIAVERELGFTPISRLALTFGLVPQGNVSAARGGRAGARTPRGEPLGAVRLEQVRQWLDSGLLVEVGPARVSALSRPSGREPAYGVEPEFRELVIRQLAARGELTAIVEATHGLLGDRSLGAFVLLLQAGRLPEFQRYLYALPRALERLAEPVRSHQVLAEAIGRPFDPIWFGGTFRQLAALAAEQVLRAALPALDDCEGVFAWARSELAARGSASSGSGALTSSEQEGAEADAGGGAVESRSDSDNFARLRDVLCEHAVLRGLPDDVESLLPELEIPRSLGCRAALLFQTGDVRGASQLLEADAGARDTKKTIPPEMLGVAPLCALICYSRGTPGGLAEARRWLAARSSDSSAEVRSESSAARVDRAFRTLVRYGAQTEAEAARLDVHQLARGASAWELFILALTVHLHVPHEVTRAGWAIELARAGSSFVRAGYSWLGRQALFLAQALSPDYFAREFAELKAELFIDALERRPGESLLCELILPKASWERALDALADLAEEPNDAAETARRVAWYVNMANLSLERPALSKLETTGWTRGRRLPLSELHAEARELPTEDARVLAASEVVGEKREFLPEAFEALIGHPRVFDGARGGSRVDVARGTCRIETEQCHEHITIVVQPKGVKLGVNVRAEGETRLVVYRVTPAMQRAIEVVGAGLRIPKDQQERALAVLGKLSLGVEVQSRLLGADRSVSADPTPCLRFSPQAGAWLVQAGVRPFGTKGRFFIAGSGRAAISLYSGGERLLCTRDLRLERARISLVILSCPSLLEHTLDLSARAPGEAIESWDFDQAGVLELLLELRESAEKVELEWPESEALNVRGSFTSKNLHGTLRRKKGWYLATGGIKIDALSEVSLNDLSQSTWVQQGRFVRLPSGDFLAVEEGVRRIMDALAATRPLSHHPREVEIHPGAFGLLGALAAEAGLHIDPEAQGWLARVQTVEQRSFEPPAELASVLRSYQVEGYRWLSRLAELGLGACLADDMGLGKTLQILALLLERKSQGPTLVVAPTSVCANWIAEAARFAPSLRVAEYAGPNRSELLAELASSPQRPDLVVCSYGLVQQDIELIAPIEWGSVVLDEAQFIKNAQSERARAVCRLSTNCRIAATGTPVENHLGDLWSIFHFLNPGLLGAWRSFKRRYGRPIEQNESDSARAALSEQIKPFILRRMKAEVLADLPPLTIVNHSVQLSEAETLAYGLLRRQVHDKLYTSAGKRDNKIEILAEITRLRRFCCHPRLVIPEAESDSSKVTALLDLVLELRENQHRVLVFSQFVDFLQILRERFDEAEVTYQYLDGSTPRAARKARVDAFQAGEGTAFLISLKAGGFGLNLTAADYVIHADPWWNPAVEAQASDRAHRIGQDRPVTVYRLITRHTIEESIVELHQNKRAMADALLEGGSRAAELSSRELVALIERESVSLKAG